MLFITKEKKLFKRKAKKSFKIKKQMHCSLTNQKTENFSADDKGNNTE